MLNRVSSECYNFEEDNEYNNKKGKKFFVCFFVYGLEKGRGLIVGIINKCLGYLTSESVQSTSLSL